MGYFGILPATCTTIILMLQFCLMRYVIKNQQYSQPDLRYFIHFLIIGVTVLVVAVLEGLPLAVTLALNYSVKKVG